MKNGTSTKPTNIILHKQTLVHRITSFRMFGIFFVFSFFGHAGIILAAFVCFWCDSPPVGQGPLISQVIRSRTTTHHSR